LGTFVEPFSARQYRDIQRELSHATLAQRGPEPAQEMRKNNGKDKDSLQDTRRSIAYDFIHEEIRRPLRCLGLARAGNDFRTDSRCDCLWGIDYR
jgi:predicted NAD-dependent protein-ADP-ribosyltransferase YbiA (DUF1768 family)